MLKEKNIVVAGLGKSGTAAAKFLKKRGYDVTATDIDPAKRTMASPLEAMGIRTEIGFHNISTFENAGLIVASPGIPLTGECFQRAMAKGVPVRGEMDLACQHIKEPVIAITGTNGKTTVTTLVSEMLKASGKKVFTGGNIGTPLISYVDQDEKADAVVVEVSSFQLDSAAGFAPDVALLLNITEDHLNRYPDFRAYQDSKWSIFDHQKENSCAMINSSMEPGTLHERIKRIKSKVSLFNTPQSSSRPDHICIDYPVSSSNDPNSSNNSSSSNDSNSSNDSGSSKSSCPSSSTKGSLRIDISQSPLKGRHNRENIEAAALAALCAGGTVEGIERALKEFHGLPHRTQYVATINGVHFYNDSKATNTDAVARAIEAFGSSTILIMGGEEKS